MNVNNNAIKRIMADVRSLAKNPSSRYSAAPLEDNVFEWHFSIRGPVGTDFEGIHLLRHLVWFRMSVHQRRLWICHFKALLFFTSDQVVCTMAEYCYQQNIPSSHLTSSFWRKLEGTIFLQISIHEDHHDFMTMSSQIIYNWFFTLS